MNSGQESPAPAVQEYSIRVPKNCKKKHHVMRFNSVLNVDFTKWSQVKMERENNQKEFARPDEDQPKFGAGSEFGREAKEEARRKKYGIISRKYKPEDQPWILKSGGKTGKKFKGIREGGVGENAAYYVFTHAADGAIEAYPLCEWYNFQPINRYKSLSAEEAEQEFGRRNKVVNFFSLMLRKRLRNEDDIDIDEGEEGKLKKGGRKPKKDLKISDMDDWMDSEEDESSSEDEEPSEEGQKEKKKKKKPVNNLKKKEKKKGSDDSAVEESDDGDEEGRELDYISDSSDSDSDHEAKVDKEMKGVAEESALRRLLNSDEEDEDEEENEENKKSDAEEPPPAEESPPTSASKKKKKKTNKKEKEDKIKSEKDKNEKQEKNDDSSSDFSPDSSDSEETKTKLQTNSANSSRCASPVVTGDKRGLPGSDLPAAKKPRLETSSILLSGNDSGITEEAVRRYLMRKPMTTIELLQKFKCKKTGLNSEQLVNVMTQILKRINPLKQTIKNKMYLSLKPSPLT